MAQEQSPESGTDDNPFRGLDERQRIDKIRRQFLDCKFEDHVVATLRRALGFVQGLNADTDGKMNPTGKKLSRPDAYEYLHCLLRELERNDEAGINRPTMADVVIASALASGASYDDIHAATNVPRKQLYERVSTTKRQVRVAESAMGVPAGSIVGELPDLRKRRSGSQNGK